MSHDSSHRAPEPATSTPSVTRFPPLDPSVLNEAIPAFFIGRNRDGFWVARDVKGRAGGLFLLETSALAFAHRKSRPWGCATIFPTERIELDLNNQGNPFVTQLGWLKRIAARATQGLGALLDKRGRRSAGARKSPMSRETTPERQQQRHSRPASTPTREGAVKGIVPADRCAPCDRTPDSGSTRPAAIEVPISYIACALAALVGGIGLTAIIALKTVIHFARFGYH